MKKVKETVGRINEVLAYSRRQLQAHMHGSVSLDISGLLSTMKIGLYLIEAVHFHNRSSHNNIRWFIASLPPHGALVIRTTSTLLALTFNDRICADTSSIVRAVETQLLSYGSADFVRMIRPTAPSYFDGPMPVLDNGMRYFSLDLIRAQRKREDQNERIRNAKKQAVRNILYLVQLLRIYEQFPEGELRESRKSVLVGNNIEEGFGDRELKLSLVRFEDVKRLQDVVSEEWGGMSEIEVVREMTRVNGL